MLKSSETWWKDEEEEDAEERWPPAKGSAVKLHNSGLPAESTQDSGLSLAR